MDLDFRSNPQVLAPIVDAMADGVFTLDDQGRFVAWSAGAERITGFPADEVLGRPCRLLSGPECKGFEGAAELLADPRGRDGLRDQECRIQRKDGMPAHLLGNLRLLRDERGRVAGAIGTFTDLTAWVLGHGPAEEAAHEAPGVGGLVGRSAAMREVFRRIRLAARSDVTTLITGESGTGKELAARAVHDLSPRAARAFVAVNCAALAENLLESELFGHRRGAFSGATRDQRGLFEAADGGTLFLDEVGELSGALQAKLLRALQERAVRPLGAECDMAVDVRLVAATHRDLRALVAQGMFREDFYFRVRVFEIHIPPLRERRLDVPPLVHHLLEVLGARHGRRVDSVSREAMEVLVQHAWPGNVRELANVLERALVLGVRERLTLLDLPAELRGDLAAAGAPGAPARTPQEAVERARLLAALERARWNRTRAAAELGISRVTLWKRLKQHGLDATAAADGDGTKRSARA